MIPAGSRGLHPRYRWSQRVLSAAWATAGLGRLRPEPAGLEDPGIIARWMAETRRAGRTPHLYTLVSPAVRLCQVAGQAGIDIAGAEFTVTGEPLTAARLDAIHRVGAEARPTYASAEAGSIGEGCLARDAADDVHVLRDRLALIQSGPGPAPLPPAALLISSLRPLGPYYGEWEGAPRPRSVRPAPGTVKSTVRNVRRLTENPRTELPYGRIAQRLAPDCG